MQTVKAAAIYCALILALGAVLGTVRVLWGAAAVGESNFLGVEILLILLTSWWFARMLLHRFCLHSAAAALAMGVLALAFLMLAELALAYLLDGEGAGAWLASLTRPPGLYGFLGQIAFGLMPWAVRNRA